MAEYIEREKILNHLEETKAGIKTPAWEWLIDELLKCYKTFPDTVDVVEVVRCKNCIYREDIEWCAIHGHKIDNTDFCNYGKVKT